MGSVSAGMAPARRPAPAARPPSRPRFRPRLRLALHLLCAAPLLWLAMQAAEGGLGANPIETVIRYLGDWALRFLVLALAVTPLRKLAGWPAVARYRRMVGLWAFAYAALHMSGYVVLDQFFDWANIGHEILKHRFITAGMAAFTLLLALAATSTSAMIRRLGGARWRLLHRAIYVAAPLATVHYVWMVKADIRQPLAYGGTLAVLLAFRGAAAWRARMANAAAR